MTSIICLRAPKSKHAQMPARSWSGRINSLYKRFIFGPGEIYWLTASCQKPPSRKGIWLTFFLANAMKRVKEKDLLKQLLQKSISTDENKCYIGQFLKEGKILWGNITNTLSPSGLGTKLWCLRPRQQQIWSAKNSPSLYFFIDN